MTQVPVVAVVALVVGHVMEMRQDGGVVVIIIGVVGVSLYIKQARLGKWPAFSKNICKRMTNFK